MLFVWKFWQVPTTFCTRFLPNNAYKRLFGISFILFRSRVINKNAKNKCIETMPFFIFANNSRSKQNEKNPEHCFADIVKKETCVKFYQKILNFVVVGSLSKFLIFQKKNLVSRKQ